MQNQTGVYIKNAQAQINIACYYGGMSSIYYAQILKLIWYGAELP
jgi:hypothetical protein